MTKFKIWVDDLRKPPEDDWLWLCSTNTAIDFIKLNFNDIEIISLDHDAGDLARFGGDYIKILDWLENLQCLIPFIFHIHSANPVGRRNMLSIIEKNKWRYQY